MSDLPVTTPVAGLFALLMVALSLLVSMRRIALDGVIFGDAGDAVLRRRIRAHGNFVEYAPLGVVALGLVELSDAPLGMVMTLAVALLAGRLLHALGMLFVEHHLPRSIGMTLSHLFFLASGAWLLLVYV